MSERGPPHGPSSPDRLQQAQVSSSGGGAIDRHALGPLMLEVPLLLLYYYSTILLLFYYCTAILPHYYYTAMLPHFYYIAGVW